MWGISCFKEWFHPAIANERIFGTGWKHTYSAGTSVAPRLCVKASNVNLPVVEPSYLKTIVIWKPSWAWIGMMKELSNVHPEWPCPPKGSSCPASDAKVSLKARRPLLVFSITNGRDQKMTYIIQDVEYLSSSYRGSVWTHRLQVESGFNRRFLDSTSWEQLDIRLTARQRKIWHHPRCQPRWEEELDQISLFDMISPCPTVAESWVSDLLLH